MYLKYLKDLQEVLDQKEIDVSFETGLSGAVSEILSFAIKSFFPVVFFVVNIGFSLILNIVHAAFIFILKKVKVDFAVDETFFTNKTTQFGRIIDIFNEKMIYVGLAILLLIVMWQLFKSLFSYMDFETDEAMKIAGRVIIFSVLIFYSKDIIVWIIKNIYTPMSNKLFDLLYDAKVMGMTKGMTLSKMTSIILANVASSLKIDKATAESLGSFSSLIQGLILIYIDFNVLIVLVKFAEKTVVFLLIVIISPVALACGVSKNTKYIFEGWLKTFVGVLVTYMLYNLILIMVILFMFLQSGGSVVIGGVAYRFIGNTSFVYATGVILGTFALMDQVETIARGLGFNTGGVAVGVSSGIAAVVTTTKFVAEGMSIGGKTLKLVGGGIYKGVRKGIKMDDEFLAQRNLKKYAKAMDELEKRRKGLKEGDEVRKKKWYNPLRSKNSAEKLKAAEDKLKSLEKKKSVRQFNELRKGNDIRDDIKAFGKRGLFKNLGKLQKESDAKKAMEALNSKIKDAQDKINELQKEGKYKDAAKLKAELEVDKDKLATIKNKLIRMQDANIKLFDKKINRIDKALEKEDMDPGKRSALQRQKLFYKFRIEDMEKNKNSYMEKYGKYTEDYSKKSMPDKIKSAPRFAVRGVINQIKELGSADTYKSLGKASTYKIAGKFALKGARKLIHAGAVGGASDNMYYLMKGLKKDAQDLKNWYKDGGNEKLEVFKENLKYTGGKAAELAVMPITLSMDVVNNLVVKPIWKTGNGVYKLAAGSLDGDIRISNIVKDMVTPTITRGVMSKDFSDGYGRFMYSSDTPEGNLHQNYQKSEDRAKRAQEKLDKLKEIEGQRDLSESEQRKREQLQNNIEKENKRMEKNREQARQRIEKYEKQQEELNQRMQKQIAENEEKREKERRSYEKDENNYNKYEKEEIEIQRMQSKMDKLNYKIEILRDIAGDETAGAEYERPDNKNNTNKK